MIEHDRLAAALALAHEAHLNQKCKSTVIPYIAHPMAVASLVFTHGGSEDQAIAALLHDTIEDAGETYAQRIGTAFGLDVLAMVRDCTDDSFENKATARTREAKFASWRQRKLAYIDHLRSMPADSPALLVSACDKLDNARAILAEDRYSKHVSMERIAEEDYNLNILRYVSTAEAEAEIDLAATHDELVRIDDEIRKATKRHNDFLRELGLAPLPLQEEPK